jgi:hypothetical protein
VPVRLLKSQETGQILTTEVLRLPENIGEVLTQASSSYIQITVDRVSCRRATDFPQIIRNDLFYSLVSDKFVRAVAISNKNS